MKNLQRMGALLFVLVAMPATIILAGPIHAAVVDDSVPDAAVVRRLIDAHIHSFQRQKKAATLGMVQQAIALSITYGAPAYNAGDRAGCFRFYADTADTLILAFPDEKSATPAAWAAVGDLRAARDRTRKNGDADRNAWTMRYAFDKTQIGYELQTARIEGLMRLGTENFTKSQFPEAQDAFESATQALHELDGEPLEIIPITCRFAPLALSNALFAQKQYKAAADSVAPGLLFLPEWPALRLDLRSLHHDPAEYEAIMEDLESQAKASPDDANLQFMLGYEYLFTGKKAAAKEQLEKTLKLDPKHAGAQILLNPEKSKDDRPGLPGQGAKDAVKT